MLRAIFSLLFLCLLVGCSPRSYLFEPDLQCAPQRRQVAAAPSLFPPLSAAERSEPWGREWLIGEAFARDLDFYRAITAYRRAAILFSEGEIGRLEQIEYSIFLCYYLGQHYREAIDFFEEAKLLPQVSGRFPALRDLLIALYDSYMMIEEGEKAQRLLPLLEKFDQEALDQLKLSTYLRQGQWEKSAEATRWHPHGDELLYALKDFRCAQLSVERAQLFNAVLPGAGYYYVGQRQAAITSLAINALFTAAAYQFFDRGYIAAGLITASLEMGWYLGGINGAGLAAKQYNETVYNLRLREPMINLRLFPMLMLEGSF